MANQVTKDTIIIDVLKMDIREQRISLFKLECTVWAVLLQAVRALSRHAWFTV